MSNPNPGEPLRVSYEGQPAGEYTFSNGAVPPEFVVAWYETAAGEVAPGAAAKLFGQGPLTGEQMETWKAVNSDTSDIDAQDPRLDEVNDAPNVQNYERDFIVDPNTISPEIAEEAAREAARYLFALAAQQ